MRPDHHHCHNPPRRQNRCYLLRHQGPHPDRSPQKYRHHSDRLYSPDFHFLSGYRGLRRCHNHPRLSNVYHPAGCRRCRDVRLNLQMCRRHCGRLCFRCSYYLPPHQGLHHCRNHPMLSHRCDPIRHQGQHSGRSPRNYLRHYGR